MPAIPNPVVIIVARTQTANGAFIANISYWEPATPPTSSSDMDAICTGFNGIIGALYPPVLTNSATFLGCEASYINGTTFFEGSDFSASAIGTAGAHPVSDQNAVVIRKITAMGGRQNRGRYFIGGLDQSSMDPARPDEVNPANINDFRALAASYGADRVFGAFTCHARHWDRKDNVLRVITEARVSTRIASRDDRRRHAPNLGV